MIDLNLGPGFSRFSQDPSSRSCTFDCHVNSIPKPRRLEPSLESHTQKYANPSSGSYVDSCMACDESKKESGNTNKFQCKNHLRCNDQDDDHIDLFTGKEVESLWSAPALAAGGAVSTSYAFFQEVKNMSRNLVGTPSNPEPTPYWEKAPLNKYVDALAVAMLADGYNDSSGKASIGGNQTKECGFSSESFLTPTAAREAHDRTRKRKTSSLASGEEAKGMITSARKGTDVTVMQQAAARPEDLPPDWRVMVRVRTGGRSAGHKDKYYIHMGTGVKLRSMAEVRRYLVTGCASARNSRSTRASVAPGARYVSWKLKRRRSSANTRGGSRGATGGSSTLDELCEAVAYI